MQADIPRENEQIINTRRTFTVNSNHLLEQRPRSTGFKSFLNWFRKVENLQRNVEPETSSLSDSSEDGDSSASSTATVASFAFLPANIYKPYGDACQPEKFIASGPYTETYRRLIVERNRRRNLDKNLSLRKKYSLYSSGTLGGHIESTSQSKQKVIHADNVNYVQVYDTFSLPALAKKDVYDIELDNNRKTASLSSKDAKLAVNCHVKGKRKAPQPPVNVDYTKTYRKKRQAPAPPKQIFYTSHVTEETRILPEIVSETRKQIGNGNKILALDMDQSQHTTSVPSELSPKPWYKRQVTENKSKKKNEKNNNSGKKKNKHEYPEVGFFRCSRIFENKKVSPSENSDVDNKQEKRASCLLPNISELDREAAEIIKLHKKDLQSRSDNANDGHVTKPSSARDLINKFNALTNLADTNNQGTDENKKNTEISTPTALLKKTDNMFSNEFIHKSAINHPKGKVIQFCTKCGLENSTSGKLCVRCIHFQLTPVNNGKKDKENIKNDKSSESSLSFEAEVFSAIEKFNFSENKISSPVKSNANIIKGDDFTKQDKLTDADEKHRLRELLKEMKNSLPKRPKPVKPKEIELKSASSKVDDPVSKFVSSSEKHVIPASSSRKILENNQSNETNLDMNVTHNAEKIEEKSKPLVGKSQNGVILCKPKDEKIKADRVSIRESNKVNSSAQTSSVAKKTEQAIFNKPFSKNCVSDGLKDDSMITKTQVVDVGTELVEAKSFNNVSSTLYINVHESRLAFPKPKIDQEKNTGNTKLLLKQLESAIAQGNDLLAAKLAKDLALLKVNCSVTSTATIHAKEVNSKSVQIYIEDQFSHQGPITLRIKSNITIADLKTRVFEELHIPTGVQKWIIGKQLTTDDDLQLSHYNGEDFDTPLFLYVVAPEVHADKVALNAPKPVTASGAQIKTEIKNIEPPIRKKSDPILQKAKISEVIPLTKIEQVSPGPSRVKSMFETPALKDVTKKTWICSACTLINSLLSPLCSACGARKSTGLEKQGEIKTSNETKPIEVKKTHYLQLVNLDNADLVQNTDKFECPVCLMDCEPKAGVTLRECLHSFCKDCLANTVKFNEEAEIKCPYRDRDYFCDCTIQEREIRALVNKTMYEQHLAKSVNVAENKMKNAFHCKSPDCKGWCIFEENVNDFNCPVCKKTNCLTCQAIHSGKNCKEYQEQMSASSGEEDGLRTRQMLAELVERGEALECPSCRVVLMKKWGCDWLRCSMCKTEICWVTRGPRWGPAGKGDTTAGCQCGLNGVKCHPKCNYCH